MARRKAGKESRQLEEHRASLAYHLMLTALGVKTIAQALALWRSLPRDARAAEVSHWLDQAVELILKNRGLANDITKAYYRLSRALNTGETVSFDRDAPKVVTLLELRDEFNHLADLHLPKDAKKQIDNQTHSSDRDVNRSDDSHAVMVHHLDLSDDDLLDESAAEAEARIDLSQLGPNARTKKNKKIDTTQSAEVVDAQREAINELAGRRQAAAAGRIAMDAGRDALPKIVKKDKGGAIGWARMSTTGHPCAWCMMLISRGAVYKSAASAGEGEQWHDNDFCVAVPVYSEEEYDTSDKFAANREARRIYDEVAKGEKDPLNALRRYLKNNPKT